MDILRHLFYSLAITASLAGCSDDAAVPPIETSRPSGETSAQRDDAAEGPMDLELAFAKGQGPVEVHAEGLEEVEAGMSCSLDSVNSLAPGAESLDRSALLVLSGWYQHEANDENELMAVVRGEKAYAFALKTVGDRRDIADAIGAPASDTVSDVSGSATLDSAPAGEYSIYYVRRDDSGLAKCIADGKITIE